MNRAESAVTTPSHDEHGSRRGSACAGRTRRAHGRATPLPLTEGQVNTSSPVLSALARCPGVGLSRSQVPGENPSHTQAVLPALLGQLRARSPRPAAGTCPTSRTRACAGSRAGHKIVLSKTPNPSPGLAPLKPAVSVQPEGLGQAMGSSGKCSLPPWLLAYTRNRSLYFTLFFFSCKILIKNLIQPGPPVPHSG